MKVKELLKELKNCNPEALIVATGFDHSYRELYGVCPTQAADWNGQLLEHWYGHEPEGTLVNVVVLGE